MRGGYRPGSGPRKGTKYKTSKNQELPWKEKIRLLLAMGDKVERGERLTPDEMRWLEAFRL